MAAQEGNRAVAIMRKAMSNTEQQGRRIYFLGLLDDSKQTWDGFLESRCGVHYSDLDEYRVRSEIVETSHDGATPIVLRRLESSRRDRQVAE
jgi:hypothetical protein